MANFMNILLTGFSKYKNSELPIKAQKIYDTTLVSIYWSTNMAILALLAILLTAIGDYSKALGTGTTEQKKNTRAALILALQNLATKLMEVAMGNLIWLGDTGYDLRGTPVKQTGAPAIPNLQGANVVPTAAKSSSIARR